MHHSRYGKPLELEQSLNFAAIIKNAKREGSILDAEGGEFTYDNKLTLWPINPKRNQRLVFNHQKDKKFTIHPEVDKNLLLYVKLDEKGYVLPGSSIQINMIKQSKKDIGEPKRKILENEQWNFEYLENGYIIISNAYDTDYVIDGGGPELTMQLRDEQKKSQFWSEIGRVNLR